MMKLMSNDNVHKLKLNNDEVDKSKNLRKKKRKVFRRGYIDADFEKCASSENIYTLILCCQ